MHRNFMFFALGSLGSVAAFAVACGNGSTGGAGGATSTTGAAQTTTTNTSASVTGTTTTTATATGTTTTATASTGTGGGQYCATLAKASCTKRDTCSLNSYENSRIYGSEAECEMRTAQGCDANLNAPGAVMVTAATCATAEGSETCQDFFNGNPPASCIATGTLATGAACGANDQCASTFCATGAYEQCGTCQPLPVAGAACVSAVDCGRDLACVKAAGAMVLTPGVCTAFVAANGACSPTLPCGTGLSCVGAAGVGICMTDGATVGAACDRAQVTAAGCEAVLGLTCIPTAAGSGVGTCQAIQLVAAGATCGAIGTPVTSVADCLAGAQCVKALPTDKTGMCVATAATNAACDVDPSKGPPCLSPARCVATTPGMTPGKCVLPHAPTCM